MLNARFAAKDELLATGFSITIGIELDESLFGLFGIFLPGHELRMGEESIRVGVFLGEEILSFDLFCIACGGLLRWIRLFRG